MHGEEFAVFTDWSAFGGFSKLPISGIVNALALAPGRISVSNQIKKGTNNFIGDAMLAMDSVNHAVVD